jgi:hypothetical protein
MRIRRRRRRGSHALLQGDVENDGIQLGHGPERRIASATLATGPSPRPPGARAPRADPQLHDVMLGQEHGRPHRTADGVCDLTMDSGTTACAAGRSWRSPHDDRAGSSCLPSVPEWSIAWCGLVGAHEPVRRTFPRMVSARAGQAAGSAAHRPLRGPTGRRERQRRHTPRSCTITSSAPTCWRVALPPRAPGYALGSLKPGGSLRPSCRTRSRASALPVRSSEPRSSRLPIRKPCSMAFARSPWR